MSAAQIISRTETAAIVGVSSDTLARWHQKQGNDFPRPIAWVSTRKFYDKAEVLAWLEARTAKPKRRRRQSPQAETHA